MARKSTGTRLNGQGFGRGVDVLALVVIAVAAIALAALALSGVSLRPGTNLSPTSRPAPTAFDLPSATPTPSATPKTKVALLGDQNGGAANSWWARSVAASTVEGVVLAEELQSPNPAAAIDVTVEQLQKQVDATTTLPGFVIVQAGSTDVANGRNPATIAANIQNLWKAAVIRKATPIVALLPPSDVDAQGVLAVNDLLTTAATEAGYPILDLHSPVASADGSWGEAFSDDGVLANKEGSRVLAEAVTSQLPALLRDK